MLPQSDSPTARPRPACSLWASADASTVAFKTKRKQPRLLAKGKHTLIRASMHLFIGVLNYFNKKP